MGWIPCAGLLRADLATGTLLHGPRQMCDRLVAWRAWHGIMVEALALVRRA